MILGMNTSIQAVLEPGDKKREMIQPHSTGPEDRNTGHFLRGEEHKQSSGHSKGLVTY